MIKEAYELVRQDEIKQRENQFIDEIEFNCDSAKQIHPDFFNVCVRRLKDSIQLIKPDLISVKVSEGEDEDDSLLGVTEKVQPSL